MSTYQVDKDVVKVIKWVYKAASKDTARPTLCSLKIEADNESITMAAADGWRLHIATMPREAWPEVEPGIYKLETAVKDLVALAVNEDAGAYPDFRAVIPEKTDDTGATFFVNPVYLADALPPVEKGCYVRIQTTTPDRPVRIDATVYGKDDDYNAAGIKCLAVVMPMHGK